MTNDSFGRVVFRRIERRLMVSRHEPRNVPRTPRERRADRPPHRPRRGVLAHAYVGYRTRLAALGLGPVMLGALVPHAGHGWMFTNAGGGWEYVAFLIVALAAQALLGDGAFALSAAATTAPDAAPGSAIPRRYSPEQ